MPFYRRLPSGLWQATVRLPDGRRRTRTDPLKAVVKRWAEDAESAVRRGEWADPQDGRITLGEWYTRWSATRDIERATIARDASHWRAHVEPRWGSVRLMAVTAWDVEAWLASMSKAGVGATTRAQSFRLLRHMLSDAARHKVIGTDPTATVFNVGDCAKGWMLGEVNTGVSVAKVRYSNDSGMVGMWVVG